MRDEYDFSEAEQGKFYRPLNQLRIPTYLDPAVRSYYEELAREQNTTPDELMSKVLRKEMREAGSR